MIRLAVGVALVVLLSACGASTDSSAPAETSAAGTPSGLSSTSTSPNTTPSNTSPSSASATGSSQATSASPSPTFSISVPDLPTATDRGLVTGGDVSWPQCPRGMGIPSKQGQGSPMPLDSAEFVILGLTNGPGFTPNPCLADQVDWVRQRGLMAAAYSVISYPYDDQLDRYGDDGPFDGETTAGRLANVGYQQARFNLRTMRRAGLTSPIIWLDVETVPGFDWPRGSEAIGGNQAVLRGAVRGYRQAGLQPGVYSIPSSWQAIVGDLNLGLPEWRPAGSAGRAEALRRCGSDWDVQGGAPVLVQWVEDGRDRDVTCPGESTYLTAWFHQY
ncbi:MAG: hypothetical protein QM638_01560 [Nocardioides sp.]|uniref:hypothetical protein n=1 Tax=Nocardioides sp. TaxID=35761 RepID=UPI0039E47D05